MSDVLSVLSTNHWTLNCYRQRLTTEQLKAIRLAESPVWFRNGRGCTLESRYVGVGVHEVWLETKG